jgi:hypothetical protein|nr:MAG TPA: tail sheath protein [Caudoviricetes sp.]
MPNEKEVFGLPKVLITFKTKSTTAIARSARGIVAMILKNETTDVMKSYKVSDITDIPDKGLTDKNVDLIKKCLLGTPLRILVYTIPDDSVEEATINQSYVLKQISNIKWNYICAPTASGSEQEDLASWIKTQRNNKYKTFKAVVANTEADDKGVINFCTGNIKVANPDYVEDTTEQPAAIIGEAIVGDSTIASDDTVQPYTIYTATEYTARIAGILAGLSLDRSATYYQLTEVESVETYEDIDSLIDKGQLLLVDEGEGDGVKIARACNSLTTFTTDVGQDFRFIKIVEAVDMITDDIRDTFKSDYAGKVINDYNHKMLFISAIMVYFSGLKGNVLDNSPTAQNTVDIDEEQQKNYAILKGEDVAEMTVQQIREYNTGTNVYLTGRITPVNAMEDLTIDFTM